MKRILLLILICCHLLPATAQKNAPKWMDKSKKAVVLITTYGKDGAKLTSGIGIFVSETGDVLSAYELFKGAEKATVTDTEGKTYLVTRVIGADELYDVIKVKAETPKKVQFFPIAADPLAVGTVAYLLPYSTEKKADFEQGTITEVSKLKDPYSYYKLSVPLEDGRVNSPILNAEGEVFGLAQADASGKKDVSYAVSASYVNNLAVSSTDFLNSVYNNIGIKKAWPADVEQAQVVLFLKGSTQDAKTYLETLNDFIATFPNSADGYLNRANHYAGRRAELAATPGEQANYLKLALDDIETASKYSDKKGDVYYNKAKLIYGVSAGDTTLTDPAWSVQAAQQTIQKAIEEDDAPVYHQLAGDIHFYLKEFDQAYNEYMVVNNSDLASPNSFYWAAKAKENTPGFNIGDVIALLDGAVDKCGLPLTSEAGQYILERIDWKLRLSQYAEAIADYDLYYKAMKGDVGSSFYFYREQAKFRAGDMEGALADIKEAVRLSPDVPDYRAEEASVYVRMKNYTDALASIEETLKVAPDFAACYRLKGICYVRMEKKAEACEALNKAKELGDPLAERLIKEHCK
ncbi:serine protease [Parabacteroides goldsteinii]|uniref:serine protease n=1 Tax=Parabacteroides goldsteinii TaxID=328812 RepID=UPI002430724A|nr:serine protease [Parabacteroides goldsteinii]